MQILDEFIRNLFLFVVSLSPYFVYVLVSLLAYLECAAFVGIFVPGETFVILAGILASQKIIHLTALIPLVTLSAFLGDVTGFFVGRRYSSELLKRLNLSGAFREYFEMARGFFDRYGAKTMLVARFVGFLRAVAPFLAGTSKMSTIKFVFYDFIGALVWSTVFSLGGYYLGESFGVVEKAIGRGGVVLFLALLAVFFGRSVIKSALKTVETIRKRHLKEIILSLSFLSGAGMVYYLGKEARQADVTAELNFLKWFSSLQNDYLTIIFTFLTSLGSGYFVIMVSVISLFSLVLKKRYTESLLFLLAAGASTFLSALLKIIYRTERPDIHGIGVKIDSFSYPSGHVVASSLIFWVLGWIIFRELKGAGKYVSLIFFVIPLGVGISRLYFGYHWPVDVLGGYALSFTIFSFWVYFYEKFNSRKAGV